MASTVTSSASALNDGEREKSLNLPDQTTTLQSISPDAGTMPNPEPQAPPYTPVPDGEYFSDQWHFDFIGDIAKIWEEFNGSGVHVGIYDDGLQASHPDLEGNYDTTLQIIIDGEILNADDDANLGHPHGTSVAGLIAASNNGFGTTGVAWGASITGVAVLSQGPADMNINFAGFLQAVDQSENFDVINHSWGRYPGFWQTGGVLDDDGALIDEWLEALDLGRGGLGTIQVKAAGNHNMNASGDGANASRATIIVGAYDDDGDAAYYSSFGVNLLVSAPSSGAENNRGVVTTDIVGTLNGYDMINDQGVPVEGNYTNDFGGTSAATPIVTGVIALMLDANENLGWRDVQNILAYSAHEVGSGVGGERRADEDHDWRYNGARNWNGGGLHYSEDYGFGSVDAFSAVRMAEVWSLFNAPQASTNETSYSSTATDIAIQDQKNTEIKFTFDGTEFDVENVGISLSLRHSSHTVDVSFTLSGFAFIDPVIVDTYLSDLKIVLVSPDGTEMTLADFSRDQAVEDASAGWFSDFNAQGFRGENGIGTWTLKIVDAWIGDEGFVDTAKITLHGRDGGQVNLEDDVYHYTDEVFVTLARDGSRQSLTDGGGNDWLNMAAMTGNLVVKLVNGTTSTSNGAAFLTLGGSANIENAVSGDGNDQISGNDLANKLYGMRGNDTLNGGAGNDLLSGGTGNDTLTGGTGADIFLFDRALNALTNVDTITDFSHIDDTIWLDASIFTGLAFGELDFDAFFVFGSGPLSALDRILYDLATGALYFDADGSGANAAIQFATLNGVADLSFDDFVVVDQTQAPIVTVEDREASTPPVVEYTDVDQVLGGDTTIFGTDANDDIRTKDGDDQIFGMDGIDTIVAGAGNDYIDGGGDVDLIMAGDGNDIVVGGGSPERYGDTIYGEDGNDILTGSEQPDNGSWRYLGARGDVIFGGDGDDKIFGLSGDDILDGGDGNDIIYGGTGADTITGGAGDDRLYGGSGLGNIISGGAGVDTAVLSGKIEDYRFFFFSADFLTSNEIWLERLDATGDDREFTAIRWQDVEYLEFADGTIALDRPLIVSDGGSPFAQLSDIEVTVSGYELGVQVDYANTVDITDTGAETGGLDRLQAVFLGHVEGDVTVRSDALSTVFFQAPGKSYWDDTFQFVYEAYQGTAELIAAAGERNLELMFVIADLGADGKIIDRTATSVSISTDLSRIYQLNGAAADDYNLAFDSATSIRFKDIGDMTIKWYVPNATTINIYFEAFEEVTHLTRGGNQGTLAIETALDDALFAIAGGSAEYKFLADAIDPSNGFGSAGNEIVRFGNLGDVNASNDGTSGDDASMNSGLGLRGVIRLGEGVDEVRVLGSGAFQGGTVDGGIGVQSWQTEADVIRMTFGVANVIGNISDHISNFEVLQLDITSLDGQSADVSHFDNLSRIDIAGTDSGAGQNSVVNILDGSTVTFRSMGSDRLVVNGASQMYSAYEPFGNDFGTVRLDLKESGGELTISFVGLEADGYDTGTINVRNAATVNIATDAKDMDVYTADATLPVWEPTKPFHQVLDLDAATSVTLSGETGWDFTVEGTDIGQVTRLDASGVSGYGAAGGVKAIAQTAQSVTFTGGAGDDELTGGTGNDTLDGGAGNDILDGGEGTDTVVFSGASTDYTLTEGANGEISVVDTRDGSVDTIRNIEWARFSDITLALVDNTAPTVSLANTLLSIAENTSTASRVKVADIVLTDDGLGT
ncbi:S8 family serine peptidase, partial [Hyphomicrobium sp. LHD-15]|uniref:S8 family serine peptidase n=1 Tax=Hyphomicrobium sp. LHD-15 TaxID=3072142 RepID=UPI00280E6357